MDRYYGGDSAKPNRVMLCVSNERDARRQCYLQCKSCGRSIRSIYLGCI